MKSFLIKARWARSAATNHAWPCESVYAKWLPAWTITFDPRNTQDTPHTVSPTWKTVIPGGTLPENASSYDRFRPTASSAVGNTFGGWYKDQSFTNYFDESSTSSTGYYFDAGKIVNDHRIVYARYFPTKTYTSLASSPDGKYIAAAYVLSGAYDIDISCDYGVTWTPRKITGLGSSETCDWLSIKKGTGGEINIVAISRESRVGKVYVSHDAGTTWAKTYPSIATLPSHGIGTITITNSGDGYNLEPIVTISAPSSGTTATATATINGGKVGIITITSVGSGYTSAPTVTISAPNSGTTATATVSGTWGSGVFGGDVIFDATNTLSASEDGKYILINPSFWTYNGNLAYGGLAYSSNYGDTWTNSMGHSINEKASVPWTALQAYNAVAVSGDGGTWYASTGAGAGIGITYNQGSSFTYTGPLFKSTDHGATWVGLEYKAAASPSNLWTSTDGSKVAIAGSNMNNNEYDYTKDVSISINSGATFDAGNKVNFKVNFPPGDSWLRMVFSDDLYSFGMPAKDIVQTPTNDIGSALYTGQYTASLASAAGRTYLSTSPIHTNQTSSLNGNKDWKGFDMSTNGKIWYACQGGYGNIYWSTDGASWRVIH
ncbi:MAG: hypothetical protein WCQ50_18700 [Spirochaetota bacterium]